ncbi:DUF2802 domain-containing protein [Chitiniphilus purpureus]|uniref:DUF2802 domain-containing protein n=1 Tax=Chitiniphilus purpureus TaxID=2981137 RepID=A0ABY6DH87_9NEIS|nr:DUF2802 domain-containing protein [Chitiniphilus sp. CD1]UXY13710.1 DUF2802 domain-containing protein [Chitiniphilus sp. CD1]
MNGIVITWPQLLYLGLALILFYAAELLLFLRKARSQALPREWRRRHAELEEELATLRSEVEALRVSLAAGAHLHYAAPAAPPVAAPEETPYAQAIRMARQGADVEAMVRECGISRGEADLIAALYRAERQG